MSGLVALLVVLVAILAVYGPETPDTASPPAAGGLALGEFSLSDQDGRMVTAKDVRGKPMLFFFGFTHCPDVCPTMLASMTASLAKLGGDGDRLGVYFVTVDPERDTAPVLKAYLSSFDPRIRGLTGPREQVAALAKSLGVYFAKVDTGGGSYSVDHSALVILLDAEGRFFGTIAFDEANEAIVDKMKRLVRDGKK